MEQFIVTQTKTNEALSALVNQLTCKFDAMATHQKAMDTHIAQQVSHLSQPQRDLSGQPETKPRGHINVISVMGEGLDESPVIVLQDTVTVFNSVKINEQREVKSLSSNRRSSPTPPVARPYEPPVH